MTRMRKVSVTGFRGARDPLIVDFGAESKSMAIFGENASGKSTITDAIEWFYWDRVDHLWRENCFGTALRHVLLPDKESASVEIHFNAAALNCKKSISSALTVSQSNKSRELTEYLARVQNGHERLALRNIDILSFVLERKTQKRQELERIIGYEALNVFRETIGTTLYKAERTSEYSTARSNKQEYQGEILEIAHANIATETQLFSAAEQIAAAVGTISKINDVNSYGETVSQLRTRIRSKDQATKRAAISDCIEKAASVGRKIGEVAESIGRFSPAYSQLIASEEQVRQIRLGSFLSAGRDAIINNLVSPDVCPLCLQSVQWDSLKSTLESRIAALADSKKKYDVAFSERGRLQSRLTEVVAAGGGFVRSARNVELGDALLKPVEEYSAVATRISRALTESFDKCEPISTEIDELSRTASESIARSVEALKERELALELSKEEQELLDAIRRLENLLDRFLKYRKASDVVTKFEAQIQTLSKIKERFSVLHASALQVALDTMSADISKYYLSMHPKEDVDHIRLAVIEDGVEFEYEFHGKRVFPPLKYLSESHLNSIGIAAFLASAKIFNKSNNFFLLDDIVTSFDSNHRIRLLRLLKDEFSNWQVIVLTHERFWFEMIKKELAPVGWLVSELETAPGKGARIKSSARSTKDQIVDAKNNGTLNANELRTSLERILKDVGLNLEVKVAFRYNDENERRMVGELLSALRGTLKKRSPAVLVSPAFSRIEVCSLVVTSGSHDSGAPPPPGDVEASYDDVIALVNEFYCDECRHYVSIEQWVRHDRKIHCRCGKKSLDWKE